MKLKQSIKIITLFFTGLYAMLFSTISRAATHVADNVLALASNVNSLVMGVCFVIGLGLLGGAFIQYQQHRRNKLMTPISKPIVMLVLGIILVCIPLLGHYFAPGGQILAEQPY